METDLLKAIVFASILTTLTFLVALAVKKKKQKTISKLKELVWKQFSIYIRSKDADFQDNISCFTCDRRDHWRTFDAGHWIPKSTGGAALYFHEKNVNPQCTGCNRFRHGNLTVYAVRLQQKYGPRILTELDKLRGQQWDRRELERLLTLYTQKVKALNERKPYS